MLKSGKDITEFHPKEGFITVYATSAVEEDKVEVFSYLMVTDYYLNKTIKVMDKDSTLQKKCGHIKGFLKQISGEFNEDYFIKIHR